MAKQYADYATEATVAPTSEPVAFFETVKVVRELTSLRAGSETGLSFGQALDKHLEEQARLGNEVKSVMLEINETYWNDFASSMDTRA